MSHIDTFLTAVERNHIQFIPTWLNTFGVDVNCVNANGDSGLIIAARNGFFDMVKLLVRNKANINQANNKGETALFAAAQAGHVKIFIYLVQSGGNLRLKDKKGRTAILYFTKTSLEYLIAECKALNLYRVLNLFKIIPQGTFPSFANGISTFKRKTTEIEKRAQEGFSQIKEAFEKNQKAEEATKSEELRQIQSCLERNNYRAAEKLLNTAKHVSQKEYVSLRHRYLLEFLKNDVNLDQSSIDFIFKNLDKNGQDVYLDALCSDLSEGNLEQIRSIIPIKFDDAIKGMDVYTKCLEKLDFVDADEQFRKKQDVSSETYKKLKAIYIKKYIKSIGQNINAEQAEAIADITPNILVTARAGSGKTTTVINKVILEIKKYGLPPESIQILAFNKKAAEEVNDRLKKFDKKLPCLASTFHSLAWHFYNALTGTAPNLVDREDSSEERSLLIGKAMDESYQKHIEEFYDNIRSHLSIRDNRGIYGLILMKKKELPLEQKYMADFLFENEFSFQGTIIEFGLRCRLFKSEYADFYAEIGGKKTLFIKFNSGKSIAEEFKKNPKSWARKTGKLIEFSDTIDRERIKSFLAKDEGQETPELGAEIIQERINFEKSFLEVLKANGIICIGKKDHRALIKHVAKIYKGFVQRLYETLVSKYQQKQWKDKEISSHIEEYCKSNPVSKDLLLLKNSQTVFQKYKNLLKEQQKIDFNILLAETTSMLNGLTQKGIQLNTQQKQVQGEISNLKILLIDEFQDFSPLFFKFIGVIKKINPNIKLFCVGDDWQAINEFAGSNVFFFENFSSEIKKHFNQASSSCHLLENYRSNQAIVMKANHFMQKFADRKDEAGGRSTRGGLPKSSVIKCPLYSEGIGTILLRIINIELDVQTALTKKYLVLARTREGVTEAKDEFEAACIDFSSEYGIDINLYQQLDIQFMTYHKAKGKEADVCIVVVDENAFPSYHPHADMIDAIFDGNWRKQAENLFYVTLTRAKDRIFFVGKTDVLRNNRYIKEITEKYQLVSTYKKEGKEIQFHAEGELYWDDDEKIKNTLELVSKIRSSHIEDLFRPLENAKKSRIDVNTYIDDLKFFFKDTSRILGTKADSHVFFYLYDYYPISHPEHLNNVFSRKLISWKQNGENSEWFAKQLDDILANDLTILTVPPHTPNKESGLTTLLKDICKKHNILDASSCLRRTKKIDKLASGGPRSIKIHLDSIKLVDPQLLEGRDKILLIDDIKSTGNSLFACEIRIKEQFPNCLIYKFTLGETVHQEGV